MYTTSLMSIMYLEVSLCVPVQLNKGLCSALVRFGKESPVAMLAVADEVIKGATWRTYCAQ